MKLNSFLILVFIMCNLFVSCKKSNKTQMMECLQKIQKKPVKLNLEKTKKMYSDADTLHYTKPDPKYRLVIYVDSDECSPCRIDRMFLWNYFMNQTKKCNNVDYIFIISPRKEQLEDTYLSIESSGLQRPIYVDEKYYFRRYNAGISMNSNFRVFLIDKNNMIRLVGDPKSNKEILKLFNKIINF